MGEAAKADSEEKLIPVGPGAEGLAEPDRDKDEDEPEDQRLASRDEDEEAADPDAPAPGARKKESAKERRERARKARDRERLELNYFMKRNEELEKRLMAVEGRTAQNETAAIDQRITSIRGQLLNADRVLAEALKKPNGGGADEFTEALRIRDELRDQLQQLNTNKQSTERQHQRTAAESSAQSAKPDPRVLRNARAWADQHDWFDFQGADEDSVIVRALDEALASEGYDPASTDYWEELTERVKRRLPERFKGAARVRGEDADDEDGDDEPRQKSVGPKFSSGGRERPLRKGEVYVSAERKAAMQQYGVWDDPVTRKRMLKRYAEWDAQAAAQKS